MREVRLPLIEADMVDPQEVDIVPIHAFLERVRPVFWVV